jgi:hypothetical protein
MSCLVPLFFISGIWAMAAMTARMLLDVGGLCFGIAALIDFFRPWWPPDGPPEINTSGAPYTYPK